MYKVLIADDEDIICRGLAGMVSKYPELQVAALAEDGEIAFEKAKEEQPDLILVDINMPFLNGLEFVEKVQKILPDAVIIIVTGYDDFEFVKKALQFGVLDYILKPVMEDNFFEILDKAVKRLNEIRESKKYANWINEQVKENRSVILNVFFDNWLNGQVTTDEMKKRMSYLNIQMPLPYWVTVIHIHRNYNQENVSYNNDWKDISFLKKCNDIVRECFFEYSETISFWTEDGSLAMISQVLSVQQGEEVVNNIKSAIELKMDAKAEVSQQQGYSMEEFLTIFKQMEEEYNSRRHYSDIVMQAMSIISKQWGNSELSLQSVADSLHISSPYLSKIFSKETGENFASYLTRKRIKEAKALLKNTNLKMYEIAQKTGYTSQHYFSNAFKKALGISPADYRNNLLKGENVK